jgi:Leucine-rich repeat (LRR) protein
MPAIMKHARQSGRLVLTERGMTTVPPEVFTLDDSVTEEEKWWECLALTFVDLSLNAIAALPPAIATLAESLQTLKLAHNALTTLPDELCALGCLKLLDVGHNRLVDLPTGLGDMTALVSVTLSHNRVASLPSSVGSLALLEVLAADNNEIAALPDELCRCTRLLHLSVSQVRVKRSGVPLWHRGNGAAALTLISACCCFFTCARAIVSLHRSNSCSCPSLCVLCTGCIAVGCSRQREH